MKHHYVYLLIDTLPTDTRQFYIGVRSCTCNPDEDPYMGSSKSMTLQEKSRCDKLILEEFSTREEAIAYEIYLHDKFDVAVNNRFYNNAKQTSKKFDTSGKTFVFTEEHKLNMSIASRLRSSDTYPKGWKHTEEAKKAIANSKLGNPRSEEVKNKLRNKMKKLYESGYVNPNTGLTRTEEQRKQISLTRKENNVAKGVKNPRFSPWFIQYPDGKVEKFYDITKEEKSILDGLPKDTYQTLATLLKGERAAKKGRFKGYIIGNLPVDDIV